VKRVTIPFEGEPLIFQVSEDNLAEVLSPPNTTTIDDLEGALAYALANPLGLREIVPGMPQGILIGNLMDGRPIVTKAGAFGRMETLVELHEYWARRNRHER
jgi:hypothetical protein